MTTQPVRTYKLGLPSSTAKERLTLFRAALTEHKLDYYIIPTADEHQSERTSATDQRREYMTGFNGSAGTAIISRHTEPSKPTAWLFVDSRYWVQAEGQTSRENWNVVRATMRDTASAWEWCKENLDQGARIGIDPALVDWPTAKSIQSSLRSHSIDLLGVSDNLVDEIRNDTPTYSLAKVEDHPLQFSGQSTLSKLALIRDTLFTHPPNARDQGGIYVLPSLPAIAWLLNLRCQGDIPNVPVFRSYFALTNTSCCLFIDKRKLDTEVRERLEKEEIEVRDYGIGEVKRWVLEARIRMREEGGEKALETEGKVLVPATVSWAMADAFGLDNIKIIDCPVDKAKAIKNETELAGFRRAYLRDGAATARWMAWLEDQIKARGNLVGEYEAGEKLTEFRTLEQYYRGLAYENISASGPNGALPHYTPVKGEDRVIDRETTYVIDAGGQYLDGTIDTTRTLHFGTPTPDQKRAFTRVLQGHIAIETTPFPSGTKGDKLDILARQYLFKDGLNFGHGVGHGIGSFLSVHEMPPGIGMPYLLEAGHVTSNEPGFYLEGEYGIRIESVIICQKIQTKYGFGDKEWLGWERITRVPIQKSLVDESLMSGGELDWLKAHNQLVLDEVLPLLNRKGDELARKWLKAQVVV